MDFEESAVSTSAGRRPVEPDLEAEVNDILDKILVEGIGSLTEAEKRLLERASAEIQRRDTTGPLG
jgi:hypothetical protein